MRSNNYSKILTDMVSMLKFAKSLSPIFLSLFILIIGQRGLLSIGKIWENARLLNDYPDYNDVGVQAIYYLSTLELSSFVLTISGTLFLFVWAVFGIFLYFVVSIIMILIFRFLYPIDRVAIRNISKYYHHIDKLLRKRLVTFTFSLLLLITVYVVFSGFSSWNLLKIIDMFGMIMIFAAILINLFIWFIFLNIRQNRDKNRRIYFDYYLLSQTSLRMRFTSIISLLVFLGIFGSIYIPMGIKIGNYGTLHFEDKVHSVRPETDVIASYNNLNPGVIYQLPDSSGVYGYLNTYTDLFRATNNKIALESLQIYFFVVVSIFALFSISLPVITKYFSYFGFRETLRTIAKTSLKSFVVAVLISLILTKTYLIDISNPIGIGTMFSYILTFFFVSDSQIDVIFENFPPSKRN